MSGLKVLLFPLLSLVFSQIRAQTIPEDFFQPDSLRSLVEVIAADSMEGRFTGSKGCTKAAKFIADQFEKVGVLPISGNNKFFMPVPGVGVNVVGALKGKGKPQQLIIFSAHYDHIGTIDDDHDNIYGGKGSSNGDGIYNGANDDASGVAAVISLAKYFASTGNNERTILFVAFTGEELGLLGSKDFARRFRPDSIVAVINIEMIGKEEKKSPKPFITGRRYSTLGNILNKRLFQRDAQKYGREFFVSGGYGLWDRSDNYSFVKLRVPAHSIMATEDDDPYYHSVDDEVTTLNFTFMSEVVRAIALGCKGLVNGDDTPSRIK